MFNCLYEIIYTKSRALLTIQDTTFLKKIPIFFTIVLQFFCTGPSFGTAFCREFWNPLSCTIKMCLALAVFVMEQHDFTFLILMRYSTDRWRVQQGLYALRIHPQTKMNKFCPNREVKSSNCATKSRVHGWRGAAGPGCPLTKHESALYFRMIFNTPQIPQSKNWIYCSCKVQKVWSEKTSEYPAVFALRPISDLVLG